MDSKDLPSPLKEPPFFDDWAAANFKVINLISDWLAAHQSPYQILRSDPSLFRYTEDISEGGSTWRAARRSIFTPNAHFSIKKKPTTTKTLGLFVVLVVFLRGEEEDVQHGSGGGSAE